MSFRQNGNNRRYGHVPVAQYVTAAQDQNNSNSGLRRQSSFDNGDDAQYLEQGNRYGAPQVPSRISMPEEQHYLTSPSSSAQSPHSPGRSSMGSTSSALSGYQHQYQPFTGSATSPGLPQAPYNPQHFARTQSQSQPSQYRPQPVHGNTSPATPSSAHQPYNPAAYQPTAYQPVRQNTVSGYNSYGSSYNQQPSMPTPQVPPSPTYWNHNTQQQQYGAPQAYGQQAMYDIPVAQPTYTAQPSPPPPRHSYIQPAAPFPSNGSHYNQNDSRAHATNQAHFPDYSAYAQPAPLPSYPTHDDSPAPYEGHFARASAGSSSEIGLQRHPAHRPLPTAPVEDGGDDDDDWSLGIQGHREEEDTQEQLFADIGDALKDPSQGQRRRPDGINQRNGDILDDELAQLSRYDSRASTIAGAAQGSIDRYASTASTLNPNNHRSTFGDYVDDESDLEAAAGLEAMRIAEEQEAQRGGVGLGFGNYEGQQSQHSQSQGESSDSDYKAYDLGLAGGGYDANLSYGGEIGGLTTGHSSEMEDQSRPLPTPHEIGGRSESYNHTPGAGLGGMTDYGIPGEGAIHPFPAFGAAQIDTSGTGGLQRPSSNPYVHRNSFDEGDEQSLHSRVSESRLRGRSDSNSPTREDMPELFYHPGMSSGSYNQNRPLPSVPSLSENTTPQLMPAGAYLEHSHSYTSSADSTRRKYAPDGPDAYPPQNMLSPGGQYVPRSSSLSSHSSAPHATPPVRSKTDAEERQARQKTARQGMRQVSGLDGFDTPQSTVTLDLPALPAGRRKKFGLSKLSSADFKKCEEPWALSSLSDWIREMAGETTEGDSDLRRKPIEEGLVSLFTHKVPTMNTADAETLSTKVVNSFLAAGILVTEEEWVKLGQGEVSGVLWQLTGSGCYSSKLHEQEVPGRCYSHHCTRTLKKINLQAQVLEPARKTEDWVTFFKLTKDQLDGANRKEIQRQNNLHEIVMSEDLYMDQINVLRVLYRDDLSAWQPPIIGAAKLPRFLASVFGKVEKIKEVNENYLLAQLKYRQKEQGPWVIGFSDIFREWIRKAKSAYIEYAAGFPFASYLVRRESDKNLLFRQFLDQARENKLSGRLDWNTYLKAPITRLQRYTLLLGTVLHNMTQDTEEKATLAMAIEEIKAVTLECDAKVDEQSRKVTMIELQNKLYLRPGMDRAELHLDHMGREMIHAGDLQRQGANRFAWLDTHAILFDNFLVLSKKSSSRDNVTGRKKDLYDVSKAPIPMQLLVLESTNDDPVVKNLRGVGAVTTTAKLGQGGSELRLGRSVTNGVGATPLEHTNSNSSIPSMNSITKIPTGGADADAKLMFPFRIKHLGREPYTLYAPTAQARQDWCDRILEALTRHATSLHEQNAEPFRLRVMADTAFGNDVLSGQGPRVSVSVKGTPLERSIRENEQVYGAGPRPGPVCRATVNCATSFNSFGKAMVAIGTDYGVYTSEANNPRGWQRSIQISKVTQIAVLEEFSLCLIIADKSLIAYHLDVIVQVSNFPGPHAADSGRKAPQKLSGTRDVSFFATARMKDRTLVFYKKKESLHSTFKVLEPVFQKSTEKKSRLFSSFKKGSSTEFFREFDEFYIPTECFTINLFHSYIAISTLKGFELMTLDKKVPMSIPDLKNPLIGNIATRLSGQKPLGMFRLSSSDFLLCYESCGVYVNKHGEVSRNLIMEFIGKAQKAAMYGAYLILFDLDFVEVRNAENGRLRQIVSGKDIRCLDYGIDPLGAGAANSQMPAGFAGGAGMEKRTLKLAMAHPEVPTSQIVLEMVLNDGHNE